MFDGCDLRMAVESDIPEFAHAEPGITWRQKPWNGVLVVVDGLPFKAGDKITFDVTVSSNATGQTVVATTQDVVSLSTDTTTVSYTIPWEGVLDARTEGDITVFYTHTPADGSEPATSQSAGVWYACRKPDGTICGPDN